jgi:hypothetical protein
MNRPQLISSLLIPLISLAVASTDAWSAAQSQSGSRYLVQAATSNAARRDVNQVGAKTERDLGIINAVAARLNAR